MTDPSPSGKDAALPQGLSRMALSQPGLLPTSLLERVASLDSGINDLEGLAAEAAADELHVRELAGRVAVDGSGAVLVSTVLVDLDETAIRVVLERTREADAAADVWLSLNPAGWSAAAGMSEEGWVGTSHALATAAAGISRESEG